MSVDPGLIRAEPHIEVGILIQRDADTLVSRWSVRAIHEQPNAKRVHQQALRDHLHDLLRALGRSLTESEDTATTQHCLPATIHGEQRWEAGWSLSEVVRDYQILRLVILDYLEEILDVAPSPRVIMAIGLALDEAIAASVAMYAKSRDEHQRRLEEERADRDKRIQNYLRQQTELLREVDRRKSEFLATRGHELRNPLAPLWHAVMLLERNETTDPALLQIRDITKRQIQQLNRLADDLLDICRIAQGKVELRKELFNLAEILEQAVQTSAPHLNARHQRFEVARPAESIWLEADPARVVQIITNLLNNAAKYTEAGGQVWLTIKREGDEATICVRDTGLGIPEEMLPHVFELFTQGEWSVDRSQGGIGVGLALVRRLVDLHGGTISVFSPGLGQGSEFTVRLRAAPSPVARDSESAPGPKPNSEPPLSERCRYRILVVDDNVDAANSLRILLSLEGHEVQVTHDGPAALALAESFQPAAILLDIGLPRMDGYEVARRLRKQPGSKDVLLVALTGYGQDDDRRRCLEAGFNVHFVKPVDLDALRSALAHAKSLAQSPANT